MPETVLVPYDDSPMAAHALEFATDQFDPAHVILLRVLDPIRSSYDAPLEAPVPGAGQEWYDRAREDAEAALEEAAGTAGEGDVRVETRIEVGKPAREIVQVLEDEAVDHVVMGSHGRSGISRVLLGSVAETVLRRSPVPVTVVR